MRERAKRALEVLKAKNQDFGPVQLLRCIT